MMFGCTGPVGSFPVAPDATAVPPPSATTVAARRTIPRPKARTPIPFHLSVNPTQWLTPNTRKGNAVTSFYRNPVSVRFTASIKEARFPG
ncbi:hypothetical protein GCM10027360_72320 [Amycolatopsis echigonensis]